MSASISRLDHRATPGYEFEDAMSGNDQATLSTVPPLPAAGWLFGGGVAGLIGLARRHARAGN